MESNTVLQLKTKNAALRAEIKALRYEKHGRLQEMLERKNRALDALHMVWCSGGCKGGVRGEAITAEMVAYIESYAQRLRSWFVNHTANEVSQGWQSKERDGEFEVWMAERRAAWSRAYHAIDEAATEAGYNTLEDTEQGDPL